METVISSVVALCMFVAGELTEHRIQPAMSDCLKGKRVAERSANDNIGYKCEKVEAELEENIDGSKAIKKLSMNLSRNFTLQELIKSDTAIRLDINNNPSSGQIEKLKALCENILQPVRDHFGRVKVTSGFRSEQLCLKIGSSISSQHAKAEAADFECMGTDNAELADWIHQNLPYDQLILEFYTPGEPNSGWIHCSYTPDQPRKQFLWAYKSEGKTKYKPVIGKARDLV